jgi:hypothetical protein
LRHLKTFESAPRKRELTTGLTENEYYQKISEFAYEKVKHEVWKPLIKSSILSPKSDDEVDESISNPFTQHELEYLDKIGKIEITPHRTIVRMIYDWGFIYMMKQPDDWFYIKINYKDNYSFLVDKFWKCDQFDGLKHLLKNISIK